jgi:flagellar biogenesis protein FliO
MSLGVKLAIVFLAFVTILTIVIFMAFRERRLGKSIAGDDTASQQASDARVMAVIFSAILGGIALTLLVAWLVFL